MHKIQQKRLLKLADELREKYPVLAGTLEGMVQTAVERAEGKTVANEAYVEASVVSALKSIIEKVPDLVLCGGVAVMQWVNVRPTEDLDFVLTGSTLEQVREIYPNGLERPLIYSVKIDGATVDFLKPEPYKFTQEALKEAKVVQFLGSQVKTLTPEYLILYKLQAGREKDFGDIKNLLGIKGVPEKAKVLVKKYMPSELEDFESLITEAEFGL